jgi:carbamoyltransferase
VRAPIFRPSPTWITRRACRPWMQTVNPRYHALLKAFEARTGCAVIINTSFNVRGEPIVCTPADAYRCFMRTEMDVLVLENCVLLKTEQKPLEGDTDWKKEFELD